MQLLCDNRKIQRDVAALYEFCEANGAILHAALRMVVGEEAIWLESDLPADDRAVLVSLPQSCLPPVRAFTLEVVDDTLVIRDRHAEPSQAQARCFEHLVAIYNATGKLATHRRRSPWFALAHQPELLDRLVAGRAQTPRIADTHARWREGLDDSLLIDTFLATRQYRLRDSASGEAQPVLLPFIDFADHHPKAPGFQRAPEDAPEDHRIALRNAKPVNGSAACRVAYGVLDALDSYLGYGFVDSEVGFVRSVPLTIEVPLGRIAVQARGASVAGQKLPPRLEDIRPWIPRILGREADTVTVSSLLIPDAEAPLALRRVLNWLLRGLNPDITLNRLRDAVLEAEDQMLAANRDYWTDVATRAETARSQSPDDPAVNTVHDLARAQLERLEAYAERLQT